MTTPWLNPAMDTREQRVCDAVAARRDDLVRLASDLIGFDTTAREPADAPRDEAALQEYLAGRLRRAGAEVELFEPTQADVEGRQVPFELPFTGRPQLVARFAGTGGGRSLLLNGHIDAVSAEPREQWTSDPLMAEVRDGNLYGRGSCDMKGGVASMVFAAEVLAEQGIELQGELIVNTITDEESSGAGGIACVRRGVRADAGIVPEPTGFDVWVACRGTVYPTIRVEGRPGHAEVAQPHWREGGAVNAIEKAQVVIDALARLREDWRERAEHRHPHLSPPTAIPTVMHAGEWSVTYPASCEIVAGICYLPVQADELGFGTRVEREVSEWIAAAAAADPWLAAHPPTLEWSIDVPPMEIDEREPIVALVQGATADVGAPGVLAGLDSWYDGATYTLSAGTPSIAYGPRSIAWAHTIDEYVPVDDLVRCAQAIALSAMRFCGSLPSGA